MKWELSGWELLSEDQPGPRYNKHHPWPKGAHPLGFVAKGTNRLPDYPGRSPKQGKGYTNRDQREGMLNASIRWQNSRKVKNDNPDSA